MKVLGAVAITIGFIMIMVGGSMLDSVSLMVPMAFCLAGMGTFGFGAMMVKIAQRRRR